MPFGAHEAMEVHEVLSEKVNMISHFNIYAKQTKNPQLRDMIYRHQQEEVKSYDAIVNYSHDYTPFSPIPPNTSVNHVTPEEIQYGLDNPSMMAPETNAMLNDYEVAMAMLQCHKNAASNGVKATVEIADPNLRQMLTNSVVNCLNQAYEVFLFMNQQGLYQVPKIKDHTAKTYLHSFQPSSESLKAQYTVQPGQSQGQDPAMMAYMQANQTNGSQAYNMASTQRQNRTQAHMQTSNQMGIPRGGMAAANSTGQATNPPSNPQPMGMGKTGQFAGGMMNPAYQANTPNNQRNQNFNH